MHLNVGVFESEGSDHCRVYAKFHFGVLSGITRLIGPNFVNGHSLNRGDHQFVFKTSELPSDEHQMFKFRYRGEEVAEPRLELGADRVLYTLVFDSPETLRSTLASEGIGHINFSANKISSQLQRIDPWQEWG